VKTKIVLGRPASAGHEQPMFHGQKQEVVNHLVLCSHLPFVQISISVSHDLRIVPDLMALNTQETGKWIQIFNW